MYLEDLLIYSNFQGGHTRNLRRMLQSLKDEQCFVGKGKYELMRSETEPFGLKVGRNGIRVGVERENLVKDCPQPKSISELRRFAGILQFFWRSIHKFSEIAALLTNLT